MRGVCGIGGGRDGPVQSERAKTGEDGEDGRVSALVLCAMRNRKEQREQERLTA